MANGGHGNSGQHVSEWRFCLEQVANTVCLCVWTLTLPLLCNRQHYRENGGKNQRNSRVEDPAEDDDADVGGGGSGNNHHDQNKSDDNDAGCNSVLQFVSVVVLFEMYPHEFGRVCNTLLTSVTETDVKVEQRDSDRCCIVM